jgi:3-oxoacyl-(acyl-carrier-protein) synthase
MGNISPQPTFGKQSFLTDPVGYPGNRLACIEPGYKEIIDAKLIRRMSRIIKMGVASATYCLQDAGVTMPDAIITGTAYGCLEDTGIFLTRLIESEEEVFTPTSFIQSTHNTIGAQIALMLQCHRYNNTYAQGGASFETALLDAIMLLEENDAGNVLVGGIDEITAVSHAILSRFGLYRKDNPSSLELFTTRSKGTIAGEGAGFFLINRVRSPDDYAAIEDIYLFYKPQDTDTIRQNILSFLAGHDLTIADIDLVILGDNGDLKNDLVYNDLRESIFTNRSCVNYKHLCGEYPTSAAFALWMAAQLLKTGDMPEVISARTDLTAKRERVLIYNHYQNIYHSLFLLSAC